MVVRPLHSTNRGFTLLELLVVIAILALIMGLLLPAVQRVREAASHSQCKNNLRQIGLGLHGYHQNHGHLPPGYAFDTTIESAPGVTINTFPGWGWAAHLLPHLEQPGLAEQIAWDIGLDDKTMDDVRLNRLKLFACPSDRGAGIMTVFTENNEVICEAATNSYAASYGYGGRIGEHPSSGNGLFYRNSRIRFNEISDGLAATIAIGERAGFFCQSPWTGAVNNGTIRNNPDSPAFVYFIEESPVMTMARTSDYPLNHEYSVPYDFYSSHPLSGPFVFADGSVRSVKFNCSLAVYKAIGTRAGDESISESDY